MPSGKRKKSRNGKSRRSQERCARRTANPARRCRRASPSHVAHRVFYRFDAAHLGAAPRDVPPSRLMPDDIFCSMARVQIVAELIVELPFDPLLPEQRTRCRRQARLNSAIYSSPGDAFRILAMAEVCTSQSRASRFSRARPSRGQLVVLRPAVVLGRLPLAGDQPVALQTPQGGEQRSGVHLKHAFADLLEAYTDAVPVHRLERERLQDEHVQGALHQVALFVSGLMQHLSYSQTR